jgi:hypothetical protein
MEKPIIVSLCSACIDILLFILCNVRVGLSMFRSLAQVEGFS